MDGLTGEGARDTIGSEKLLMFQAIDCEADVFRGFNVPDRGVSPHQDPGNGSENLSPGIRWSHPLPWERVPVLRAQEPMQ